MKSEDLMLGDWVLTPLGTRKVYDNSSDGGVTCSGGGTAVGLFSDFELKPIPLTSDILLKNGFEYHYDEKTYFDTYIYGVLKDRGEHSVWEHCRLQKFATPEPEYRTCECLIKYVHELQHYLRMTGVTLEIRL